MADKKFGVKQLDLIGTGTPTIQSANNLNLNATTTAISNDVTVGGNLTVTGSITGSVGSIVKHGSVATNTGTEAAFTNIPSIAKKITVAIHNFSVSGSGSDVVLRVGDSGGYATTGYQSSFDKKDTTSNAQSATDSYGIIVNADPGLEYNATVELVNVNGNSWTISHVGGSSNSNGEVIHGGGSISLSNALDRLKVFGGGSLDHGYVTVYYETTSDAPAANTVSSDAIVLQTAKSSATQNSNPIEFTDIPEDAYEITLMFNGVSLDGSDNILVELGTSSSYITQGYTATSQTENGTSYVAVPNAFPIYSGSNYLHHGKFDINKFSDTSYTFEGQTRTLDGSGIQAYGSLSGVSGTITRLRIKPSGTNNFDAGSINISYKTPGSGSGQVSVKDFGAIGNGVANDKSAIQAAINSLGSSGGSIYFPHGDYLIDSQILIDEDRISLIGDGIGTKIICNNPTSGAIKVTKTSGYLQFFTILDLQIQMAAGASVTAGAALELDEVSRCNIQNVYIDDGFIGVLLKGVQQCNIDNLQVLYEDNNFGAGGTGRRFLKFLPGSTTNLHGGDIFITNFNGRCGNNFDCEYGVEVTAVDGLWISNSHIGNCEDGHMLIHHNTGVKTVGILCDNVWFDQTTTGTYGVVISGTGSSLAGFYRFNNCTFLASAQNDSANAIFCSGVAGNISINDCEISGWGSDGIYANNTTGDNRINNCSITNCGLTNGDGIQIDVNTGWTITNNKIKGGQHQHHIRVVQPSSYVYVNNNIVDTPAQQGSITDFTGTNISNRDNIGFNPAGYLASPTPSSPWTYTNSYGYPIELFVNGGSSGQAGTITAVQYKGRSISYPQNSYELRLGPGESATITFTGNLYADVFGL